MPGFIGSPHFEPSRSSISGSMSVSGSMFVSGSLTVWGTTTLSGSTYVSGTFAVSASDGSKITGVVSETTAVCHYYANGTTGDDANDGLTVSTPKLTLQAVVDLVPDVIKHNTGVHLNGTFTGGTVYIDKYIPNSACLIIDGGSSLTVVADDAGSPWVADIHSTTTVGLTTAGWVVDAYLGYWVEIVDGPCIGQTRLIVGNTADTITPTRNFSGDPGLCQFRIVKPTTTITNTTVYLQVQTRAEQVSIQRLLLTGTTGVYGWYSAGSYRPTFTHIIHEGSGSFNVTASSLYTYGGIRDPISFLVLSANTGSFAGLSCLGTSKVLAYGALFITIKSSYLQALQIYSGMRLGVDSGSRVKSIVMQSVLSLTTTLVAITNTAGYAITRIKNTAGVGVSLNSSKLNIGTGVDISDCTSHGIECNNSKLHLAGAVTGAGNTGAGVYAHSNSVINTTDGTPPTLTGTVGEISTDGTTEFTTWDEVDEIHRVVDIGEGVIIKKV